MSMLKLRARRRRGGGQLSGFPLTMLPQGAKATVVGVVGGRGLVARLSELGFVEGTKVKMLVSSSPGPILVEVKDSRIALGRGAATRVLVRED